MGLKKTLSKFLMAQVEREEGDFASYMERLKNGDFRDRLNYGVAEEKRGFLLLDPVQQPGALYCGGMGSGKSIAMRFTVATHFMSNSDQTFYIMVDPLKGMNDYAPLFGYRENVATALDDGAKLIPVIEMVYAEMMARKDEFSRLKASSIYTYEDMIRKGVKDDKGNWIQKPNPNYPGMARLMVCMEEFHAIPNSEYIKYHLNSDREGSPAHQLKTILRVGRSYGITILVATQRATADDFPSSLKPGITQLMAFRVNNPGDATAINLPLAADIRSEQRGRCVYEGGFIQFPFLDTPDLKKMLKDFHKPLKAELLKYQPSDYHKAFEGEGNAGMVKVKTLKSLLENHQSFNYADIATRFLESFDFSVRPQSNNALSVQLIAERDGQQYGVMIMLQPREQGTDKAVAAFKKGLELLGCKQVIVINNENNAPGPVTAMVNSMTGSYYIDREDLMRIANVLDNREKLEKEKKFDELYQSLSLIRKKVEEKKEDKKEEKSVQSEEEDIFAAIQGALGSKVEAKPSAPVVAPKEEIKAPTESLEARPVATTGGSAQLMELRERLRANFKEKDKKP